MMAPAVRVSSGVWRGLGPMESAMSRTACRKPASLVDMDLGLKNAAPPDPRAAEGPRAAEKDADQAEIEETLAKIASIIRARQG